MRQIVVKRTDGGVSLISLADGADPDEVVAKWSAIPANDPVSWRLLDAPIAWPDDDRTFRNAWTDDLPGDQIDVDMAKARAIHLERIRQVRDELLEDSDVEFTRAVEEADLAKQAQLKAKRQALRDVPQTFNLEVYTTPKDLKAAWPPELGERRKPVRR